MEQRAANEAAKAAKAADDAERAEAAAWSVGAKSNNKARAEEDKEAERRRKAAEKAMLEAAEAEELSGVAKKGKTKKKGKDDFDLLNAALASQPKTKAQKEADAKKAADEERRRKEESQREISEQRRKAEEEEIRRNAARGIVMNHTDRLMVPLNNRLDEDEDFVHASGLDDALDTLQVAAGGTPKFDEHPERRQKAAYQAYYNSMLPALREENPNLKLSQYKERIFDMWKTAPENPMSPAAQAQRGRQARNPV
jgi:hypothetical protein